MDLKEFLDCKENAAAIEWESVERAMGLKLHDSVKSFYSRAFTKYVRGEIKFKEAFFLEPTGNDTFDKWFSKNKCERNIEIRLDLIPTADSAAESMQKALTKWTGGNDFGKRFLIGTLYMKIGSVLILLNNDTGKVEWMDCGYGYFKEYEKNPNGILADSTEAFLEKLRAAVK